MKLLVAMACTCTLSASAFAIVVSDTSQYIDRPNGAVIGRLNNGTCVPIGERFALTANHVGVKIGTYITVDGQNYRIKNVYPHPSAPSTDLKVVEIDGPPFFDTWMSVHPDPQSVPAGSPIYIGGWGMTYGSNDGNCVIWGPRDERWATNTLEGHVGHWSWYRFDTEIAHEGMAAVYDSGSPLIVADDQDCSLWVVGVASSATSGSSGPSCDGHTAHYTEVDPLWLLQFEGPRCPGDLDSDGDTDVADFSVLAVNFGHSANDVDCMSYRSGDLDENGVLDLGDVNIMIINYGCEGD